MAVGKEKYFSSLLPSPRRVEFIRDDHLLHRQYPSRDRLLGVIAVLYYHHCLSCLIIFSRTEIFNINLDVRTFKGIVYFLVKTTAVAAAAMSLNFIISSSRV